MQGKKKKNSFGIAVRFLRNTAVFTAGEGISMGDFYKLPLPFHHIYVTTSPQIIQQEFVNKCENYKKSKIYWQQLKAIIGDSIGTLEGKNWTELRLLEQAFFKPSAIQDYFKIMESVIDKHIHNWKEDYPKDGIYNISELLPQINIEIILKTVFGIDDDGAALDLAHAIRDGENIIAWRSKYPWRPYSGWITGENFRAWKGLKIFDKFVQNNFYPAKPGSMINVLYHSFPSIFSEKKKMKRIRNELIVHLGAGTETAAVSVSWALYLLSLHPEIYHKAISEIAELKAAGDGPSSLSGLPYLKTIIDETLRLYPPSHAIIRDTLGENNISGYTIKPGSTIFASVYGLHRNPGIWDNPDKFDPDRFCGENRLKISDYAYIPFGVGKHTCIGKYLAFPMMMLSMLKILQHFDIEENCSGEVNPLSLSTLKPEKQIKIKMTPK